MDDNEIEVQNSSNQDHMSDEENGESIMSSVDENENEEILDDYEADGFLIDDDEVGENMKEEKKKRKRLRKGTKRKRLELEEEDLELIAENLEGNSEYAGLVAPKKKMGKSKKKSSKLKKPKDEKDLEQMLFPEEEGDHEGNVDEEDDEEEEFMSSEEDSWIVDDEDEEGGAEMKRRRRKSRKDRYINSEQFRTANELYNYEEYLDMVRDDDDMYGTSEYEEETKDTYEMYLTKGFEPSLLEEHFKTSYHEKIRDTDIPENLQYRLGSRPQPTPEELQLEAEWIYDRIFPENVHNRQKSVISKIGKILQFILVDYLEVPFISTYRREYWLPDLSRKHLWDIYDLDQRYFFLYGRKMNLKQMLQKSNNTELAIKVDSLDNEQDAQDFLRYVTLHQYNTEETESNIKMPEKRDFYSRAKKLGVTGLIKHFGVTPQQVALNLENIFMKNFDAIKKPEPLFIEDTFNYFKSLTDEYDVKRSFKSDQEKIESFINTITLVMAEEIATEPLILQLLRPIYFSLVTISTTPTELGKTKIDDYSPFRPVKRLNKKPATVFSNGQYLLVDRAESEGLLNITFEYNEDLFKYEIVSKLEQSFLPDSLSDVWNDHRRKVIETAIKNFLKPDFDNFVRKKLKKEADEFVANQCAEKLEHMLMAGPYKPPENQEIEDGKIRIMACCVNDRVTECVQLDHNGEVEAHVTVSTYLRYRENDQAAIKNFVSRHKPCVIVVGTDRKSNLFFPALQAIVEDVPNLRCTFANTDISNVYKTSKRALEEFPSFNEATLKAISIGRRLLDPLLEISGLNNETDILKYEFHPLMEYIDQELLLERLKRCFINVTNAVGVDINRVVKHKWMHPVVSSICGLGPVKSYFAIRDIFFKGFVEVREDLEPIFQSNVYRNAAGFIKILHGIGGEEDDPVEMLDLTRIHPEHYDLAKKVAKDAVKDVIGKHEDYVDFLLRNPQNLEKIDIDYFATQLEEKGLRKRLTLEDIKNELNNPFAECRELYTELTLEEVQDLIAKDEKSFEGEVTVVPLPFDPYLLEDKEEEEKVVQKKVTFVKRSVTNPYFLNYTSSEAKQYLSDKDPLTFIIRPSSNRPDRLTISFSFYGNTILNLEVQEEEKDSEDKIGKVLKIGNERFDGIDDLVVNYIDPIVFLAEELTRSRYYKELNKEDAEAYLISRKRENPQSIPYCICPSFDKPGYFYLYYLPGTKTVYSLPIGLRHDGLRFKHQTFKSSDRIIKYFKMNFNKIIQERQNGR